MNFVPSSSLLEGTATLVNNHMHMVLGQTHSTIHMPYVFEKLVFQAKVNLENLRSVDETVLHDTVSADIIKTVNAIYKEKLRYMNDEKALSRPFDEGEGSSREYTQPLERYLEGNGKVKATRVLSCRTEQLLKNY